MLKEKELTYRIRSCVYEVYRELGHGFLEKVYENALIREFQTQGIKSKSQVAMSVSYKGDMVGHYIADLLVEGRVIVEIKAQINLPASAEAQLLNYLKTSGLEVGLLVNFVFPKATVKRLVL